MALIAALYAVAIAAGGSIHPPGDAEPVSRNATVAGSAVFAAVTVTHFLL